MSRILIIEDDQEIAALQKDYLSMSGYDVNIASNAADGLSAADEADLIILDIMLPDIDGFKVLEKLRERSDIPVILLSAKTEDIDKIRGLGLGADDYIQKPFSPSELVARVKAHLQRYERLTQKQSNGQQNGELTRTPIPMNIRGLEVNPLERSVEVFGKKCSLTPKEFDILVFLMENPNRVFSKEGLYERIWGLDSYGDADAVTVHVRRLREKIEPEPQNPQYVETVWGVGYKFRM